MQHGSTKARVLAGNALDSRIPNYRIEQPPSRQFESQRKPCHVDEALSTSDKDPQDLRVKQCNNTSIDSQTT